MNYTETNCKLKDVSNFAKSQKESSQIHLLYSCNEWKEWSSMRLIMASTSENKIRKRILEELRLSNMEYTNGLGDIRNEDLYYINNLLKYGFIQVIDDGKVQ